MRPQPQVSRRLSGTAQSCFTKQGLTLAPNLLKLIVGLMMISAPAAVRRFREPRRIRMINEALRAELARIQGELAQLRDSL